MIPQAFITEWKNKKAPWIFSAQVEQDLILERLLVELYQDSYIQERLVFRGGTALNKLFCTKAYRYSEDLDFTQLNAEPMGMLMTRVRKIIDPILGKPKWKQTESMVTFYYSFISEVHPQTKMRVKIEINTREHMSFLGTQKLAYEIESKWFSGHASILTVHLEEMLTSKMRALYQRNKGRDLFDIIHFYQINPDLNWHRVMSCFETIMKASETPITRAVFEKNLINKIKSPVYLADMDILIAPWVQRYKEEDALKLFKFITPMLPGDPWVQLET
jgi:predicted nucleotidyltransferase component of viral defense system